MQLEDDSKLAGTDAFQHEVAYAAYFLRDGAFIVADPEVGINAVLTGKAGPPQQPGQRVPDRDRRSAPDRTQPPVWPLRPGAGSRRPADAKRSLVRLNSARSVPMRSASRSIASC